MEQHSYGTYLTDDDDLFQSPLTPGCYDDEKRACTCDHCGKVFNSVWYLKQHAVKHSSDRPFKCKHCSKTYRFRSNLYQHKCVEREMELPQSSSPRRQRISPGQRMSCSPLMGMYNGPGCKISQPDCTSLEDECLPSRTAVLAFLEQHRDVICRCNHCALYFPCREYLEQHAASHRCDDKVKCLHCSECFDTDELYAKHKTYHVPQSVHVCSRCRGRFCNRFALKVHLTKCANALTCYGNNWLKMMGADASDLGSSSSSYSATRVLGGTSSPSVHSAASSRTSIGGSPCRLFDGREPMPGLESQIVSQNCGQPTPGERRACGAPAILDGFSALVEDDVVCMDVDLPEHQLCAMLNGDGLDEAVFSFLPNSAAIPTTAPVQQFPFLLDWADAMCDDDLHLAAEFMHDDDAFQTLAVSGCSEIETSPAVTPTTALAGPVLGSQAGAVSFPKPEPLTGTSNKPQCCKCDTCGRELKSARTLKRHVLTHTVPLDERRRMRTGGGGMRSAATALSSHVRADLVSSSVYMESSVVQCMTNALASGAS